MDFIYLVVRMILAQFYLNSVDIPKSILFKLINVSPFDYAVGIDKALTSVYTWHLTYYGYTKNFHITITINSALSDIL